MNTEMPEYIRRSMIRVQGGKQYLPTAYRIVWFRSDHAEWGIHTEIVEGGQAAGFATVKATIFDTDGKVIASAHKTEEKKDFPAGWVEKAETGAIGRALALCGYGTQFDETLYDGADAPADSPLPAPVYSETETVNHRKWFMEEAAKIGISITKENARSLLNKTMPALADKPFGAFMPDDWKSWLETLRQVRQDPSHDLLPGEDPFVVVEESNE